MRFAPPRRVAADINLTPLIDILFLVLVFLVVTATFTDRAVLRISLPEASTAEMLARARDGLVIAIDAEGTVYLDGEAAGLEAIARRIQAAPDRRALSVTIAADERTPHGHVIQVVDVVRQHGVLRMDIETFPGRDAGRVD